MLKRIFLLLIVAMLVGCVTRPPRHLDNVCHIFKEYPAWHDDARDVARRWWVPVAVQMAIIHQESKFDATARPGRKKFLGIIPWKHPTTAYGYSQALDGTWAQYKRSQKRPFASRNDFFDGVDFIGWYANQAYKQARIPRSNAYELYLAYHEGIGGYLNKSYLKKRWLMQVARKVDARSRLYQAQLASCRR